MSVYRRCCICEGVCSSACVYRRSCTGPCGTGTRTRSRQSSESREWTRPQWRAMISVTRKNRQMSIKVAQKWFHEKYDSFWHLYKNCLRMWEIWAKWMLPKSSKSCPKFNKSPNLVTLAMMTSAENTHLLTSWGKVSAALVLLNYLDKHLQVWSNPNQPNWRSALQWYFPLRS